MSWSSYAQTKTVAAKDGQAAVLSKTSVMEYALIKIVDNALVISIFILTIGFSAVGAWLEIRNYDCSHWFLDIAKVSFGVLLGNSQRKGKNG